MRREERSGTDCPALQAGQSLRKDPFAISGGKYPFCSPAAERQTVRPNVQTAKGNVISCRYHSETFQAGKQKGDQFPRLGDIKGCVKPSENAHPEFLMHGWAYGITLHRVREM